MNKLLRLTLITLLSFFSVNSYSRETIEAFRYGPASLNNYQAVSGVIYDFAFPAWLEGTWWAAHYSDGSVGDEVKEIPRKPEQKMGRPFEFYGWLVRVPEGSNTHSDYKAIRLTEIVKGKAWVLNMVSLANPSQGADLVINKIKQEGSDVNSLVFRWRTGIMIEDRAIYVVSIGFGSILQSEKIRRSYLEEKYVLSPSPEAFDYKVWFDRSNQ
jgi:hypothetical protein